MTLLLAALATILERWRAGLSTASRQSQGYAWLLSQSSVAHDQPFMLSGYRSYQMGLRASSHGALRAARLKSEALFRKQYVPM